MASPKVHLVPTGIIAIVYLLCSSPLILISQSTLIVLLILGLGILIDIDHLSIKRIKNLLTGNRKPVEGWVNWAHTDIFAWLVIAGTVIANFFFSQPSLEKFLPLISYVIHMMIDAGNREILTHPNSPLPVKLHKIVPPCLRYSFMLPPKR